MARGGARPGAGRPEGTTNDGFKAFKHAMKNAITADPVHDLKAYRLSAQVLVCELIVERNPAIIKSYVESEDLLRAAQVARITQQMQLEKERHELEMERLRMEMNATKPADESTEEEQDLYDYVDEETEEVAKIYRKNLDTEE